MLLKLNWLGLVQPKLKNNQRTFKQPLETKSYIGDNCHIKDIEELLETSRKDYDWICILSFGALLLYTASICTSHYFSLISPDEQKLNLFIGLTGVFYMSLMFVDGFRWAILKNAVSSSYSKLHWRMNYLPRGPHNLEMTKQLNQMKYCMRELSNWQNVKDFIFLLFQLLAYIGLIVWQIHIASIRNIRSPDVVFNVWYVGIAAIPIGVSLGLSVKNWIILYQAKKLSEHYVVHSIV